MISFDFDGRAAIVTGGAQGIGKAVTEVLAKGGARIAIWDWNQSLAEATAYHLEGNDFAVEVDISDWHSVEAAYAQTISAFGRVDIVVNSARDCRIKLSRR